MNKLGGKDAGGGRAAPPPAPPPIQTRASDGALYIKCPICNRVAAIAHALAPVLPRQLYRMLDEHIVERHTRERAA